MVLIGGTRYAGEMKKSIFTALNYLLPCQGVMPMHCSANLGPAGDTAVFFGLSGTGKTTLSADPTRQLIGDDEHGWSDRGVFNFEGGCYAKVIRLRPDTEPEIYAATQMFGTVLENVVLDPATRTVNFDADTITENTRACYPIDAIPNHLPSGAGGHPTQHRLPRRRCVRGHAAHRPAYRRPGDVSLPLGLHRKGRRHRAGRDRAIGHFFGLLRRAVPAAAPGRVCQDAGRANRQARRQGLAGEHRLDRRPLRHRYSNELGLTRAMLRAALSGELDKVKFSKDPVFGFEVPTKVPEVPAEVLSPRGTWADPAAYDAQAKRLVAMFRENFEQYRKEVPAPVAGAGPV